MTIYNISKLFEEEENYDLNKYLYWFILSEDEISSIPFEIDRECIFDLNSLRSFSQINFYNEYTFMALDVLEFNNDMLSFKNLNIFFGKNYLITVYKNNLDVIDKLILDLKENKNCFVVKNNPKISTLLYMIIDRVILKNYSTISSISSECDKIEISILKEDSQKNFEELIRLRGQVYRVKKYLYPLRYIGDSLILNENGIIDNCDIVLFERINEKFQKLMGAIESLNQQLSLVREAYESELSNKTNQLMKVFTLVASIFLPLDLLTSFFGMSFEIMPLRHSCYSIHIVVVVMIVIVCLLIILFKRKDWL
ncbi:magnesium and cobalt transporter [Candidatus Arthromitus sp. SFB-mouse-Japan]|uniref:magnesium transporter CorA family protein n=1 Tax=unclassified Candidatus Neoarthromitus TaxID=2638829 RepID=UPI00021B7DC5|nr:MULTISPECIES: magnesium transporter CorA family protein [unclassified Candidatus Arthromitus]EIA26170.1 hypothetical protein SFB5_288G7 [Candidatus Arthromitus sp. SFB-5]EIA26683.1 hypothetical protein SFB4_239G2 [Candidatus Arthromitus sp. SFB-4]EIA29162.1 CorA metal ion transporter domain protein [Candidatus Arthromitus sp. SFB-co]EIA30387.1 CorA metal ion transporter domain protein [Candidatus Arthromitus sp. SFB-mouse-SU]AID44282.1 Magnesium and cobalt transport protein [Candidatus Arth